ncbi:hypothetical protein [Massilia consociata]|uniref:Antimicrobial peptide resistance and lipid A acylation PagP n=1 Tax=Massilia consociata TaxID=760117 RepID=A0ABV6FI05_9BURK
MHTVSTRIFCCAAAFAASLLAMPATAHANGIAAPDNPFAGLFAEAANAPKNVQWDVYMTGYAHHGRSTYTGKQISKMNEQTLGAGLGRTLRDKRGNDESLYVIGMRDSHERAQWMAGYAYQWIFPVKHTSMEVGMGFSALMIRRHDWHGGRPFPAVLPVASIGKRDAQLLATYVPRISNNSKTKGDILLVMLKMAL